MIPYIENYENPQIGDFFMVRSVTFRRNNAIFVFPVFAELHTDPSYQPKKHYHIDWRFMSQRLVDEHRTAFQKLYREWRDLNAEYYEPIVEEEIISELFMSYRYERDFDFPAIASDFSRIKDEMIACGAKMKKMRCPHHGANLTSCKPINDIVTCPQHGLQWNVKTGELII